jgi:hypothetical protein
VFQLKQQSHTISNVAFVGKDGLFSTQMWADLAKFGELLKLR